VPELRAQIEEPEIERSQKHHQVRQQRNLAPVTLHDPGLQVESSYILKRRNGAFERRQLTSLNVHLNQIRRRDSAFFDETVDRPHWHCSRGREVSFLPIDGR